MCNERYTLLELHADLQRILGVEIALEFAEARKGDVKHSPAAIERVQRFLTYQPLVNWNVGLRQTINRYQALPVAEA